MHIKPTENVEPTYFYETDNRTISDKESLQKFDPFNNIPKKIQKVVTLVEGSQVTIGSPEIIWVDIRRCS